MGGARWEMTVSISERIYSFLAILALGTALEGFATVVLYWKLVALAVCLSAFLWVATGHLCSWIRPQIGFFPETYRKRLAARYALSAAGLVIVSVAFMLVGYLIVNFYAVIVEDTIAPDGKAAVSIHAPIQHVQELDLDLPPKDDVRCMPFDVPDQPETRADLEMIDLDGQSPQWRLTDFVHPQKFNMQCVPAVSLVALTLRTSPPKIDILYPNRRMNYETYVCIGGSLICLVALIVLWFRSR